MTLFCFFFSLGDTFWKSQKSFPYPYKYLTFLKVSEDKKKNRKTFIQIVIFFPPVPKIHSGYLGMTKEKT